MELEIMLAHYFRGLLAKRRESAPCPRWTRATVKEGCFPLASADLHTALKSQACYIVQTSPLAGGASTESLALTCLWHT